MVNYFQVSDNYFKKVYANGKYKRVSKAEYLSKNSKKGGQNGIESQP